jgi:hypothetical protein
MMHPIVNSRRKEVIALLKSSRSNLSIMVDEEERLLKKGLSVKVAFEDKNGELSSSLNSLKERYEEATDLFTRKFEKRFTLEYPRFTQDVDFIKLRDSGFGKINMIFTNLVVHENLHNPGTLREYIKQMDHAITCIDDQLKILIQRYPTSMFKK